MRLTRSERIVATALAAAAALAAAVAAAPVAPVAAVPAAAGGPVAPPGAASARADSVTDSAAVGDLLRAARGADPLVCELARRTVDQQGGWGDDDSGLSSVLGVGGARETPRVAAVLSRGRRAPDVVPPLRVALGDADPCVRRLAAPLLGRIEGERARDAMLGALRDPSPTTRHAAAIALGFARAPETRGPLLATLRTDAAAPVRAAAAWALGRLRR
jgi:hypothetical protein